MRLGKYELLCELASGGMGTVHVARQVGAAGFTRLVAIKRLHRHLLKEPQFRAMVRDEALLASQIHHPNVVPVVDLIEQDDELCPVLEYVPSVSLSALMRAASKAGEPLPRGVVSRIITDALAGLHAAHEVRDLEGHHLGIVHRDVSPQNVIVGIDGSARLIDFGIAKASVTHALTKSGELKGKLPYMSPEQLRREPLDRRADIFAAGAMTFEVLTGSRRFTGPDEGAILLSILLGGPCDLGSSGFSLDVDAVVNKALADKDDRFVDAREFQDALERAIPPSTHREVAETVERLCGQCLAERAARIRESTRSDPQPLSETNSGSSTDLETVTTPVRTPPPRSRKLAIGAALVTTCALGVGLYMARPRSPQVVDAASPATSSVALANVEPPPVVDLPPAIRATPSASSRPAPAASAVDAGPRFSRSARPPKELKPKELKKNPFQ